MDLHVIELSSYDNIQALVTDPKQNDYETILSHTEIVEVFIAWQLDIEALSHVTTIPARSFLDKLMNKKKPVRVFSRSSEIRDNSQHLGRIASLGFNSCFATNSTVNELQKFFATFYYSVLNAETADLRETAHFQVLYGDIFTELIEQEAINNALNLCYFGHDSDPIYIASKENTLNHSV